MVLKWKRNSGGREWGEEEEEKRELLPISGVNFLFDSRVCVCANAKTSDKMPSGYHTNINPIYCHAAAKIREKWRYYARMLNVLLLKNFISLWIYLINSLPSLCSHTLPPNIDFLMFFLTVIAQQFQVWEKRKSHPGATLLSRFPPPIYFPPFPSRSLSFSSIFSSISLIFGSFKEKISLFCGCNWIFPHSANFPLKSCNFSQILVE